MPIPSAFSSFITWLKPVHSTIGSVGRSASMRSASWPPVRFGIVWSVITRSNSCGADSNASSASLLLLNAVTV